MVVAVLGEEAEEVPEVRPVRAEQLQVKAHGLTLQTAREMALATELR